MRFPNSFPLLLCIPAALSLSGCNGIFGGIYDEPDSGPRATIAGELYIDASDWTEWHYIDLRALADSVDRNPSFNPSVAWITRDIPATRSETSESPTGIYTYWYDVFGNGISTYEYRDFYSTDPQPEPENWTFAVHRNNVRTNGCVAASTGLHSFDDLPTDAEYIGNLRYQPDEWNETDVWVVQDRMLLGLIGNQGITVNSTLSSWLKIDIPPMPPAFTLNSEVFVIRLDDGSYGAVQLTDYQSETGTKCCLTIKYRYPI